MTPPPPPPPPAVMLLWYIISHWWVAGLVSTSTNSQICLELLVEISVNLRDYNCVRTECILVLVKCWLDGRWLVWGGVMWDVRCELSSLPCITVDILATIVLSVLGPLLCCSIKQLGYYVLNWLVLLLIMPSCCKGRGMATHLTCITRVLRTHQAPTPPSFSIQQSPQ